MSDSDTRLRRPGRLLLTVLVLTLPSSTARSQGGVLAAGTPDATNWYSITGREPGPTVFIIGGMHGNEPAGAIAAEEIRGWRLERGTLIVVPRANVRALAANKRLSPRTAKYESNLNRNFPRKKGGATRGVLATAIWDLVQKVEADWLVDLHEGFDFNIQNKKSVGSTVITFSEKRMAAKAKKMVDAVNETVTIEKRRFRVLSRSGPVNGSLARAAWLRLGIPSMIVETTTKSWAQAVRARQHRIMVRCLAEELGLVFVGTDALLAPRNADRRLRVGIFSDGGVGGAGPKAIETIGGSQEDVVVRRLCGADVRAGHLREFDVVVFPGGSGSTQTRSLGKDGREAVRRFVQGGGGYVGICAGAYLAAANYTWSLGLVDANVIDRKHWARGKGTVQLEFSDAASEVLGPIDGRHGCRYANGPILAPAGRADIPDYRVLATYRSDIEKKGVPKGVMPNTPAIVAGRFGRGRVVAISPHPEQTKSLRATVGQALRWAAGVRQTK